MTIPSDYINSLKASGKREKARAFMEYYTDMHEGEVNSLSFYAKSWGKKGKGTVSKWISEFRDEIDKYHSYWQLKNNSHHHNVTNKSGRKTDGKWTGKDSIAPKKQGFEKSEWTIGGRKVDQDFNSKPIVDEEEGKADLNDIGYRQLTTTYSLARGYVKADEAYEHYRRVKQIVPTKLILKAAIDYLNDDAVENKYGLTKFLKNMIFMQYIPEFKDITIHGKQRVHGTYKQHEALFVTSEGKAIPMKMERFVELLSSGSVEFGQRGAA
jgi:hypothetical protein